MDLIREMNSDDGERVLEIYRQGILDGGSTFNVVCPPFEEWDRFHLPCCRYVYESDGTVLGWIALSPTSRMEAYRGVTEVSLYVDENAVHRGIGSALLLHLEKNAPNFGIWSLYSVIIATNEASIALHKKCGFRTVGYRERIARDRNGRWQNTVLMEKRL